MRALTVFKDPATGGSSPRERLQRDVCLRVWLEREGGMALFVLGTHKRGNALTAYADPATA